MSDTPTIQEQCYGTCWAASNRIEDLERELVEAKASIIAWQQTAIRRNGQVKELQEQLTAHKAALEKCEKLVRRTEHAAYCDYALPGPHSECSCGLEKALSEIAKLKGDK